MRTRVSDSDPRALGALLLACLSEEPSRVTAALRACSPGSLVALPAVSVYHGVEVPVRRALAEVELPDPALHETLDRLAVERAATGLRLQVELEHLRGVLDRAGVRWAVLKGPVLADVYYPRPGRSFDDLDLLVEPSQLGAVLEALSPTAPLLDRNWVLIRSSQRGELTLALPNGGALDLHWHVLNEASVRRRFRVSTTELLDRAQPVTTGTGVVPSLDPVDTLLHVASHACLSGGHRLQWCVDVKAVATSPKVDWSEVVHRGRGTGLALPVGVMLARTKSQLGLDLPPLLLGELGGGTGWAMAMRALNRARPMPEVRQRILSGRTVMASTRDTTLASAGALASAVGSHLATQLRRGVAQSGNPLHREGGDDSDREAFLAAITREDREVYATARRSP